MSTLNEVVARINSLNARATQINNLHNQKLGERKSAEKAYAQLIAKYKEQYGIEITPENIQAEYNNVLRASQESANELEKIIVDIESGEYQRREIAERNAKREEAARKAQAEAGATAQATAADHDAVTPAPEVAQSQPFVTNTAPAVDEQISFAVPSSGAVPMEGNQVNFFAEATANGVANVPIQTETPVETQTAPVVNQDTSVETHAAQVAVQQEESDDDVPYAPPGWGVEASGVGVDFSKMVQGTQFNFKE